MTSKVEHHRRDRASGVPELYGREEERAVLGALLERARQSQSSALVVRGPPGIGKSALIEDAVAQADGFRILDATGVESESGLAFAGLHQLLRTWVLRDSFVVPVVRVGLDPFRLDRPGIGLPGSVSA